MKKAMINILILALVLINLVLSVITMFTFVPAMNKTVKLVDKVCKIIDLDVNGEGKKENDVALEDLEYVQITFSDGSDSQVFNLKQSDSNPHHIKLGVTLALNRKHGDYKSKKSALTSSMNYIAGKLGDVLIDYTVSEANSSKSAIEKRVLKMLHDLFESDFIYDVSFTQFIIS